MWLKSVKKLSLLYDILFSVLLVSLTLSTALPNIITGFLILIYCLDKFYLKNKSDSKVGYSLAILIFLVLYMCVINVLKSANEDFNILSRYLIFIIIPFLAERATRKKLLKLSFIIGINICTIYSFCLITDHYIQNYSLPFGNNHMVNKIILIERPYLGFMCTISSILSINLAQKLNRSSLLLKSYLAFCTICSISLLILISARMSIISIIIIGLYFLFILFKKGIINIRYIWISVIIISSGLIFLISQTSLGDRFYITNNWEKTIKKISIYEPRVTIWDCAFEIMSENKEFNYLTGFGSFNQTQQKLTFCYSSKIQNESKKEYYISEGFNSHNQFLDFLLTGGLIGFLLFIFFIASLFYKKDIVKDKFHIAIIITFVLFFSVENVLHRQLGCYMFGLLFLFIDNSEKDTWSLGKFTGMVR